MGGGYIQIVTSPPKKIMYMFFILRLFLVSAAAAELWLTFRWWNCLTHQPECACRLNSSAKISHSSPVVDTQIHIKQEARNRFYRSLNMLLAHQLIYLILASYVSIIQNVQHYLLRTLIKEKLCHYLPGDIGGGSIVKKVTNGDIGGGGYKVWHFRCDIIFEWSLNIHV